MALDLVDQLNVGIEKAVNLGSKAGAIAAVATAIRSHSELAHERQERIAENKVPALSAYRFRGDPSQQ